jgi:replicative DNA helicase
MSIGKPKNNGDCQTLPNSIDGEQGVLGSMLISPREVIPQCVEKLGTEYFYVPAHRTIYDALIELHNAGQGIDLITFTQLLRDRNLLDNIGGAAFVTTLFTFVPTAANIDYYIDIVREKYRDREIVMLGRSMSSGQMTLEDVRSRIDFFMSSPNPATDYHQLAMFRNSSPVRENSRTMLLPDFFIRAARW